METFNRVFSVTVREDAVFSLSQLEKNIDNLEAIREGLKTLDTLGETAVYVLQKRIDYLENL